MVSITLIPIKNPFWFQLHMLFQLLFKESFSFLSITKSCRRFPYNLSKESLVFFKFSSLILCFCCIYSRKILIKTLSFKINQQAIPVEKGIKTNPKWVFVNFTEIGIVVIITKASTVFVMIDNN